MFENWHVKERKGFLKKNRMTQAHQHALLHAADVLDDLFSHDFSSNSKEYLAVRDK
jgi:hypothetical protein